MILRNIQKLLLSPDAPAGGSANTDAAKFVALAAKAGASQQAPPEAGVVAPRPTPIKPTINAKPSEKALEGDFDDIGAPDDISSSEPVVIAKIEKKEKVDEQSAVKDKKEEVQPTVKKDTTKIQVTPPVARDYAGFTDDEAKMLKQMSNESFSYVSRMLKEHKELKAKPANGVPENYYQHPDAYILLPEYREVATKSHRVDQEMAHWKQQLLNIRGGKPWKAIQGYDKEGNIVLSDAYKPTDEAEIDIQNVLSESVGISNKLKQDVTALQTGFKQRHETESRNIRAEREQRFAWVKDEKVLDHKVNIPEVGEVTLRDVRNDFINLFPKHRHNDEVTQTAADLFTALQIYGAQIRELQAGKAQAVEAKEEVLRAEPSADKIAGGKGGESTEFTMDGMPD